MTAEQKLSLAVRALLRILEIAQLEHHYPASVKVAGIEGAAEGCLETLGILPTDACECEDCQERDKPCHSDCDIGESACQGCRDARELSKDLEFERKLLEGYPV